MKKKVMVKIRNSKTLLKSSKRQKARRAMYLVEQANKVTDPLEPFSSYRHFGTNDLNVELCIKKVTDLDESTKTWIFDLTKRNMQSKYEVSGWGWNSEGKMKELMDKQAWYLIATSNNSPVAFSHFRFDLDQDIEVLYCYELQLEETIRGIGLGKFMMEILEKIALKNQMKKVVLTILKNNQFSNFFKAIGYVIDESSPVDTLEQTYTYEILSKSKSELIRLHSKN